MTKTPLQFRHNGRDVAMFVDGGVNLLVALRELIGDMTPKFGCGQGGCGACTVLIDGELHLSCLTLAETVAGRSVETLDGLKDGPNLHPLQRAFAEQFRGPVRILHAGHADGGEGTARSQSAADARRGRRGDLGQYLPLHRL